MQFRKFLVEMETTPDQKDKIREIITKLMSNDKKWFVDKQIIASDLGDHWILNYIQGRPNEYNRLVRGMIIDKPNQSFSGDPLTLIKSFPFMRFFNRGEEYADSIDFSNSEMLEKLDGTMVGIYFPGGDPSNPQWHTRKMSSRHQSHLSLKIKSFSGVYYKLLSLIGEYVKRVKFDKTDVDNTYVLEFIHDASAVLTKYSEDEWGLYLIAGRNVQTHKEFVESQLDEIAKRIGVRRPRRWDSVADDAEISAMMAELASKKEKFEGFVFRDRKTGARVKLKSLDYLKYHRALDSLAFKRLVPIVFEKEESEVLAYLPQAKSKIAYIKNKIQEFKDYTLSRIKYWMSLGLSKQELSEKMLGRKAKRWDAKNGGPADALPAQEKSDIAAIVFLCLNKNEDEYESVIDRFLLELSGQGKSSPNIPKLLDLLGIEDDEEENPDQ